MNVLAERTAPPLRARMVACDCGSSECRSVFALVQLTDSRPLWLTINVSEGEDGSADTIDDMLDDPGRMLGDLPLRHLLEAGLALIGTSWERLDGPHAYLRMQSQCWAWVALPEWMERLPAGELWSLRDAVFGRALTAVPRALWAKAKSYVPEGPQPYEDFEQDAWWGLDPSASPVIAAVSRDRPVPAALFLDRSRWDA